MTTGESPGPIDRQHELMLRGLLDATEDRENIADYADAYDKFLVEHGRTGRLANQPENVREVFDGLLKEVMDE